MKRLLATICTGLMLAWAPAIQAANTWGTDLSDMWWIPAESGWGANIAHQGEIVFMTLYVYGADSRVRWYLSLIHIFCRNVWRWIDLLTATPSIV